MQIRKLSIGNNSIWSNTYIIGEEGSTCIVIDPGYNENGFIDNYIDKHHTKIDAILLTHGHFDHINALSNLKHKSTIYMSEQDFCFLQNPRLNCSKQLVGKSMIVDVDEIQFLNEGDELSFNGDKIKVIETPFHTNGSLCFCIPSKNILFSGDSLFHLGVGRTDLPRGDYSKMHDSLKKIALLPKETIIYPGHGDKTTLRNEISYNPYMRNFAV